MLNADHLEGNVIESIRQMYNDDGPTFSEKKQMLQSIQSYLDECSADLAAPPVEIVRIPNYPLPPIVDVSGQVAS